MVVSVHIWVSGEFWDERARASELPSDEYNISDTAASTNRKVRK